MKSLVVQSLIESSLVILLLCTLTGKSQHNKGFRRKRQVLINNVENGVFHGETKYIETLPISKEALKNIEQLEEEIAKRIGLNENIRVDLEKEVLNKFKNEAKLQETKELIEKLFDQNDLEERRKSEQDLLSFIKGEQEKEDIKDFINKFQAEKEAAESLELIKNLYGSKDDALTALRERIDAEERRKLLEKIKNEGKAVVSAEEALIKRIKETEARKTLLESVSTSRPSILSGSILDNPYLGNRRTLMNQIKNLSSPNGIINEIEFLTLELLSLGNNVSQVKRDSLLKGIFERTKILRGRKFCSSMLTLH